ncbi:unspecific monooxygenase [Mycobacterium parascrofulaceum ATCC BAA-614]|uniref:Unspecific monooxygenase n=1 Tax=Mycobacterium parascrofulaceum ATCC BAA-614 TaxID=525368 RepID=D5P619_9MYCO|nr:cytochrome P450 [Mycobacterium parascrofulaceum]EFG78505.1 unspecific monooxygenase [Mycobacterium parascrofulaceum ATCC BAA-614]
MSSTTTAPPAPHVPPGSHWPTFVQGLAFILVRKRLMQLMGKRFGPVYSARLPLFGPAIVISDPALIKQLFQTPATVARGVEPNLDVVLGKGSMFGLQGDTHRRRRKLLVPPFHGNRMRAYESLIEEETRNEIATWPQGAEFPVLPSTMRITLNAILRAVFGAQGAQLDALRELMPKIVTLGSRLALIHPLHHDLGPWSPWGRYLRLRRQFDGIVTNLIAEAESDPDLGERTDVLALMLEARYDDGAAMSHSDIADELLTLLAAGHETTATSLAWAIERLRRHPEVLSRLVDEIDAGQTGLLQATIYEVQRTRPVIDGAARQVIAPAMPLGQWVIPQGYTVLVNISGTHNNDAVFADADRFNPDRFRDGVPDSHSWIPFGGGTRRCLGAAFANMEMNVVLRTVLREYQLVPTTAPAEKWHSRGIAYAPRRGGRALVYRRPNRTGGGQTADPHTPASTTASPT